MTMHKKSAQTIDAFIKAVGEVTKTAADPLSEPGSIGGPTEHPVKSVDDRLEKAKEGERSAENTKDVKADQGPASVDSGGEAKAAAVFGTALSSLSRFAKKQADGS